MITAFYYLIILFLVLDSRNLTSAENLGLERLNDQRDCAFSLEETYPTMLSPVLMPDAAAVRRSTLEDLRFEISPRKTPRC